MAGKAKASVGFSMQGADKLLKQLEALAIEVREKVGLDALKAGMVPVHAAVYANTPESSSTGSRKKQSTKSRGKWSGSKKLKDTIRSVLRVQRKGGITSGVLGLVGPSYSDGGGHGNLFSRDHKNKVLWGRSTGGTRIVNQFVKRSADESKAAARAAVIASLRSGIASAAKGSTSG
jgi:hypothetical protein